MKFNYNDTNFDFKAGTVILAGAGPGCLKLTTLKVLQSIKIADVIIYDALVNPKLLKNCKKTAKIIFGGKTKNKKACSQKEINDWMITYAQKKRKVLRLKGGDPSFFSRGSQEINFLRSNKITFQIFSGITSSQIAIKNAGLSFFNKNGICNFITGHRRIISSSVSNQFKQIYYNNGKIIVYMGISQIKNILCELIELGISKKTKVFIIANASLKKEKMVISFLSDIEDTIINNKILPPAIIIIDQKITSKI